MKYSMVIIIIILTLIIAGFLYFQFGYLFGKKHSNPDNHLNDYWYTPAERDSLMNVLVGGYIDKSYIERLIKTKSPIKAIDVIQNGGWFSLERSKDNENMLTLSGDDFHSSFKFDIELARNDSLQFSCLRISPTEKNTLYLALSPQLNVPESKFIKCSNQEEYINKIVIAGTYSDSNNPSNLLTFHPNGVVDGLVKFPLVEYTEKDSIVQYKIMLDSYGSEFDRLFIGDSNEGSVANYNIACYIYEVKGNFLNIYQLFSKEGYDVDYKGKLLYTLRKIMLAAETTTE